MVFERATNTSEMVWLWWGRWDLDPNGLRAVLKRIAGGVFLFFGSMFEPAIPYGGWNAATSTPIVSTNNLIARKARSR